MPIDKPITATSRPTGLSTRDSDPASMESDVIKALEGTVPIKRGSRKTPSVLKFPTEIGSDEIPHVMQFKIFWRWERKDLTDARRIKAESETKMNIANTLLSAENNGAFSKETLAALGSQVLTDSLNPIVAAKFKADVLLKGVTDPSKIREMLEETVESSQSQISSIQEEINRGSGFSPMSQQEGTQHSIARQASDITETVQNLAENVSSGATRVGLAIGSVGATEVANVVSASKGKPPVTKSFTDFVGKGAAAAVGIAADIAMNLPQYDQMVSIYLPVCTSINGEDTFQYGEKDMKELKGLMDVAGSPLDASAQGGSALISDAIGEKFSDAKQAFRGTVMNPRLEKMFSSNDFRNFSFAWDMYPKNQEESRMINDIIETFRYHASPSVAESVIGTTESSVEIMLRVPAEFTVRFLSTNPDRSKLGFVDNEYIPKVARCALTSITVNRTPQSLFSTFQDNSPIGIQLTLAFSEITKILRQDIEKGF